MVVKRRYGTVQGHRRETCRRTAGAPGLCSVHALPPNAGIWELSTLCVALLSVQAPVPRPVPRSHAPRLSRASRPPPPAAPSLARSSRSPVHAQSLFSPPPPSSPSSCTPPAPLSASSPSRAPLRTRDLSGAIRFTARERSSPRSKLCEFWSTVLGQSPILSLSPFCPPSHADSSTTRLWPIP